MPDRDEGLKRHREQNRKRLEADAKRRGGSAKAQREAWLNDAATPKGVRGPGKKHKQQGGGLRGLLKGKSNADSFGSIRGKAPKRAGWGKKK